MKIELSIKDDDEMRNYIKDMIKNQVKGIIREEIQTAMTGIVEKKLGTENFDKVVERAINESLRWKINSRTIESTTATCIEQVVNMALKGFDLERSFKSVVEEKADKFFDAFSKVFGGLKINYLPKRLEKKK